VGFTRQFNTALAVIPSVIPLSVAGNLARKACPRLGQPAPPAVPARDDTTFVVSHPTYTTSNEYPRTGDARRYATGAPTSFFTSMTWGQLPVSSNFLGPRTISISTSAMLETIQSKFSWPTEFTSASGAQFMKSMA